ncbi:MAG: transposase [Clostridia bacterium]|nr:transposase [Clostridia bacterium]
MIEREKDRRGMVEIVAIEDAVPSDHLLRKIDNAVAFHRIYKMVEDLYSTDQGRRSVDPVIMFKIVLVQHIYGIPSLRQALRDIHINLAYRWFLGFCISDPVPHFATVSYNFKHRMSSETIQKVFGWLLEEIANAGFLTAEAGFIDATAMKTGAKPRKGLPSVIQKAAQRYEADLRHEMDAQKEEFGEEFEDMPPIGEDISGWEKRRENDG